MERISKFSKPKQKMKLSKIIFNKKIIKNSILPILASAIFFLITVLYFNNQNYGLALEYDGKQIATVPNEEVYEKANRMILDQINPNDESKVKCASAQLKIAPVKKQVCCESPKEVKDKIIEKSQKIISEGCGIYADGKLIAIGKNEQEINSILTEIISEKKSQNPECEVEFAEEIEISNGIFSPEEIKSKDEIKKLLTNGTETATEYIVVDGDTVIGIAENFGVSPEELLAFNKLEKDAIAIGDKLIIKTVEKSVHPIAFKTVTEEREIPYSTEKSRDSSQDVSYKNVTQEGKNGKEIFTYKIAFENGEEIGREELEHKITEEPTTKKVIVGVKNKPSKKSLNKSSNENKPSDTKSKSGELNWPLPFTKKITSSYGKRGRAFHKGIDIAGPGVGGKKIIASQSGTVAVAGNSRDGYGNHVVINHGNGLQTVYAHCQKVSVYVGQKVSAGEEIASVGSTGDSTGNHLHFEVRKNGSAQNPLKYV